MSFSNFLLIFLFIFSVESFELAIKNKLACTLSNLQTHLPNGGLAYAPREIHSDETSLISFILKENNTVFDIGIVTFTIADRPTSKLSIAWQVSQVNPKENKVGLYYGERVASNSLLTDILNNAASIPPNMRAIPATDGWHSRDFEDDTKVSIFMSSAKNIHGLEVVVQEKTFLRNGIYYIRPASTAFSKYYLKSGSGAAHPYVFLDYLDDKREGFSQWNITLDQEDGFYKVRNYLNHLFLTNFKLDDFNLIDLRDPIINPVSIWPENRWRWQITRVTQDIYTFTNQDTGMALGYQECVNQTDAFSSPIPCTRNGQLTAFNPQEDHRLEIYTYFKLTPIRDLPNYQLPMNGGTYKLRSLNSNQMVEWMQWYWQAEGIIIQMPEQYNGYQSWRITRDQQGSNTYFIQNLHQRRYLTAISPSNYEVMGLTNPQSWTLIPQPLIGPNIYKIKSIYGTYLDSPSGWESEHLQAKPLYEGEGKHQLFELLFRGGPWEKWDDTY